MQLRLSFWLKRPAPVAANFLLSKNSNVGRTTDMQQNLLQGNNACPHDYKKNIYVYIYMFMCLHASFVLFLKLWIDEDVATCC